MFLRTDLATDLTKNFRVTVVQGTAIKQLNNLVHLEI